MRPPRAALLVSYAAAGLLALPLLAAPANAAAVPLGCPSVPTVAVRTAGQLSAALANAAPGQVVHVADGVYRGTFRLARAGTATRRIVVCGSRSAALETGSTSSGYVLHLDGASHVTVSGLTLRYGKKGLVADRVQRAVLTGLTVHSIGEEGIHLRSNSSDNLIETSRVSKTGKVKAAFGEGIYVGSAVSNWDRYTGGLPDRSDRNRIIGNIVATTAAESIDIKEGTTGGLVQGNHFDGVGMTGEWADSWIDLKGNGWTVVGNTGVRSRLDGFQTHVATTGWGERNTFDRNVADVRGPGYGIRVHTKGDGRTNRVTCANRAPTAALGLTNVTCLA